MKYYIIFLQSGTVVDICSYDCMNYRDIMTTSDKFVVASTGGLEVAAYYYRGDWKMELKFIPVRCITVV